MKNILKKVTDYKGFIFEKVELTQKAGYDEYLAVHIRPRKGSRGVCPECGRRCPTYDTAKETRRFQFVALWTIPVWFFYFMRRIQCPEHESKQNGFRGVTASQK